MLTIRMKRDSSSPARLAGKLYKMEEKEARPLVESGLADWEYVPESIAATLTSAEPASKAPARVDPPKKAEFTDPEE